ncbi:hypothetical protein N0V94_003217 [Neodidymelliopsis sp. IMI 364377]|nr:hypothetical protein N0V94_003217 [Neodidymelliopsis sp. IMI 364377]
MVPALNTVCKVHGADTIIPERSITVHPSRDQLANAPSFTVDLGSIAIRGFPGAKCTVDFKQALHSFSMWIIDMQPPDVSQNQYWSKFNESLLYQDTLVQDYTITYALAEQTASALTYMNHLTGQNGMLDHLLRMSRKLQQDIETIVSDAHGLSVIMAVLVQNMISFSDDISPKLPPELPTDPNHIITSYPIQWQIYGSGPRLAWQWAAVFVLIVILGCFLFGLWQTGKYWIAPGSWTEIPGMMMVAQATVPKLRDIEDEKKASKFLYCIGKEPELMLYEIEDAGQGARSKVMSVNRTSILTM